jgi:hypothetical protein
MHLWRGAAVTLGSYLAACAGVLSLSAASTACSDVPFYVAPDAMAADTAIVPDAAVTMACGTLASALCAKLESCAPSAMIETYGALSVCVQRSTLACEESLTAPGVNNTPPRTTQCATDYGGYGCADYLDKTNLPASCALVPGALDAGAGCALPEQCASEFCSIPPGASCGTCAAPPTPNTPCGTLTSCGQTLTCTLDSHTCVAIVTEAGAPCGTGLPCGAGLSCVSPAGGTSTCKPAGETVGATCDGLMRTAAGCDPDSELYCNTTTNSCQKSTYVATGACGLLPKTSNTLCTAGSCPALGGKCAPRQADGERCETPQNGAFDPSGGCFPPARCINQACTLPAAASCGP